MELKEHVKLVIEQNGIECDNDGIRYIINDLLFRNLNKQDIMSGKYDNWIKYLALTKGKVVGGNKEKVKKVTPPRVETPEEQDERYIYAHYLDIPIDSRKR